MRLQLLLFFGFFIMLLNPSFSQTEIDFSKIDKHARKAPKEVEQDLGLLADYLAETTRNDMDKVRGIYVWITHNIKYDYQAYNNGNKRLNKNNQDVLRRKKAVCFGYSTLFKALCEQLNIEAELISGYSWDILTSNENPNEPDHAWNAVKIDTNWFLLDATWGRSTLDKKSTFVKNNSQDYFLITPKAFIKSHLPEDPMWQLLNCPIDLNTFFSMRSKMGAILASEEKCFDFRDSITSFKSMSIGDQKIKTAENAMLFNPSQEMKSALASTYIDQAGILSNQVEVLDQKTEATKIIRLQNQIINLFRKAVPLSKLYDWQWKLFINTLINQAVISYNAKVSENRKETLESSIGLLSEAQKLLNHPDDNFFKDQAQQQCNTFLGVLQKELRSLKN